MARSKPQGKATDEIPTLRKPDPRAGDVEFFDCEQRSEDWFQLRRGIPTSSLFAAIMAEGEGRQRLLYTLAGERLTSETAETYTNAAMQRGIDMEQEARAHYEFTRGVEVEPVGFVLRSFKTISGATRAVGASPDGFVGKNRVLEIKTMIPALLIELVKSGRFPTAHRAQVHGTLWITGREVCDLKIFYRKMPVSPTFEVTRDDHYISEIAERVEAFDYDLRMLVEEMQNMGKGKR